jgi:predicted nucleic acid-binding protein
MTFLVDADVIIDATKRVQAATNFLEMHEDTIVISVLTIAELIAGVRSNKDRALVCDITDLFPKIDITESIAVKAGELRGRYLKSHHTLGLVDCLLAATALEVDITLVTLNKKHYPMLSNSQLLIPYKKS